METIEQLLIDILAVDDSPAARRLCLDVWHIAQTKGEEEGLAFGKMVLEGVKNYVAHRRMLTNWWDKPTE